MAMLLCRDTPGEYAGRLLGLYLCAPKEGAKSTAANVYTATNVITVKGAENILHEELRMMDCIHSMAPKDEDLLRHVIDGEPLPKTIKAHLDLCTVCQQRLATYSCTNSLLLKKLYRSQCPSTTRLSHYCAGMLSPDEVMTIASHLEICPLCMTEVVETRRFLADSELFPEPGEPVLQTSLQRVIANLVSRQVQLVTRSDTREFTEAQWPRQYQADTVSLSLHLSQDSRGDTILLGLISSTHPDEHIETFDGVKVELYCMDATEQALSRRGGGSVRDKQRVQSEEPLRVAHVDDLGNVIFTAVPVGSYIMIVYLPETEMVVEGLVIEGG